MSRIWMYFSTIVALFKSQGDQYCDMSAGANRFPVLGLLYRSKRNFGLCSQFCLCEALIEAGQLDEIEVCLHGDGVLVVIYCDSADLIAAVNHYDLMVALAAGYPSEGVVIDLVRKAT